MAGPLAEAVRASLASDGAALAYGGEWRSWAWLGESAKAIDAAVQGAATVGLVARNRPAHVAAIAAALVAGRTTAMIHAAQTPAGLAADIRGLRLPAVLADMQDWSPQALEAAAETGTAAVALVGGPAADNARTLVARGVDCARAPTPEVAFELLSSGTTGASKRLPLSWDALAWAVSDARSAYAGSAASDAPQIMAHPLATVAGVAYVVPPLVQGRRLVLLDRFEPWAWAEAVRDYRPTRGTVPPVGVHMLIEAGVLREHLASLSLLAVGGGRLDPDLQARFEELYGIPVLPAFGATEFGGVIANWSLDLHRRWGAAKRGSAGRASRNVALRIVDPEGFAELRPGEVGLLEARVDRIGPAWVRTTDLASLDADGFLWLHGRADGAINRGGFKILPEVVADALRRHPAVADAAVIGLPDARLGEVPAAVVELAGGQVVKPEALRLWLKDRLVAYQVPVEVKVVEALPRTASMKVCLPEVKALFA